MTCLEKVLAQYHFFLCLFAYAHMKLYLQKNPAMINLFLSQYNLLTTLPHQFTITDVDVCTDVTITLGNIDIYTTRLYENGGKATLYGFRDIVRENMLARGLSLASLTIRAQEEAGEFVISGKYILFSEATCMGDVEDIIWRRFLTTRSFYVLPLDCDFPVSFFSDADEQFTTYADCIFKDTDGTLHTYTYELQTTLYNDPHVYCEYITPGFMKETIERREGRQLGTMVSFTFHTGQRSITAYISDEPYEVDFYFRNSFNTTEHVFVYGTTVKKTVISRKEAVSQGVTSFYDKSVERRHEVETSPMSMEEAEWFNEFLESSHVYRWLNDDWQPEVLISDITSEISDNAKELVKMKFSWRYNDNSIWI